MIKQLFLCTFLLSLSLIAQGQGELVPLISTYFGGNGKDWGFDICKDSFGNCYLAGTTTSTNLPVSANSFQSTYSGSGDVFIAKFDASLNLIWCTYIGGNSWDSYVNVECSNYGYLYVSLISLSPSLPCSLDTLFQYHGGSDPYVSKFDLDGNFIWGRYLGSGYNEGAVRLSIYNNFPIISYIRTSHELTTDFPTAGTFQFLNETNYFSAFENNTVIGLPFYSSIIKLNDSGDFLESASIGFSSSITGHSQTEVINNRFIRPIGVAGDFQSAYLPDGTTLDQSDRFLQTCFFEFDLDTLELVHYSYPFPVAALSAIHYLSFDQQNTLYSMMYSGFYPDSDPPLIGNFGSQLPIGSNPNLLNQIPDGYHQLADSTGNVSWSGYLYGSYESFEKAMFRDSFDIIKLGNGKETYPFAVNGNFSQSNEEGSVVIFDGDMNLVLSTLFGGSGDDYFYSGMDIGDQTFLAVGASSSIDYPTTANAFQSQNAGSIDGILTIFKYNHVGIEELTESSSGYRVYPLPAKESVTIELKENEFVNQSKLFNATGSLIDIQSNPSSNQRLTLKTADLLSGLYLVQLYHGNAFVGSVKIVVE